MAEHIMHLSNEPFKWIKLGKSSIEIRLYDEKRKKLKIDDIIIFKKLDECEEIKACIKGLLRFNNFRDLFLFIPKKYLAHESIDLEEQVLRMRKYYSEEDEKKQGVLAIWFEMIK